MLFIVALPLHSQTQPQTRTFPLRVLVRDNRGHAVTFLRAADFTMGFMQGLGTVVSADVVPAPSPAHPASLLLLVPESAPKQMRKWSKDIEKQLPALAGSHTDILLLDPACHVTALHSDTPDFAATLQRALASPATGVSAQVCNWAAAANRALSALGTSRGRRAAIVFRAGKRDQQLDFSHVAETHGVDLYEVWNATSLNLAEQGATPAPEVVHTVGKNGGERDREIPVFPALIFSATGEQAQDSLGAALHVLAENSGGDYDLVVSTSMCPRCSSLRLRVAVNRKHATAYAPFFLPADAALAPALRPGSPGP